VALAIRTKLRRVLSVAGIALVWTTAPARAQTAAPKFTAEDRFEIQELLHRYMFVLDNCPDHNNGYDYADLYTEDGSFGVGGSTNAYRGREALARAAGRLPDGSCNAERFRGPNNQIHLNVGEIVVPTPDGGAKGTSYLLMIDGPAGQIYWAGWYEDTYARTPKGWRFKSRVHMFGGESGIPANAGRMRREWRRMVEESMAKNPPPARGDGNGDGRGSAEGSRGRGRGRGPATIGRDPLTWVDSK
jgi:SnoaL-like protein